MIKKNLILLLCGIACTFPAWASVHNVRDYGAKGDGVTIDSPAINAAIDAAAREGGGVVYLPAGRYASYSVRLASHVHFYLEKGCVLLAAEPSATQGYDMAEDFEWGPEYQDYGHSHWKNSLIWGIGLENISDADTRPVLVTDDVQGLRLNNITVDGRDVTDEIRNR